jgi:uncharacterized delta-60 repeat protein
MPTRIEARVTLPWGWLVRRVWSVRRWGWALIVVCAVSQVAVATSYAGWGTTLDPTFGKDGAVVAQVVPGVANAATSIALQSDGDVLVGGSAGAGQTGAPGSSSGFVARLLPDGRFDSSFGDSGLVALADLSPISQVAVAPGGHILVLGGSLILLDQNGSRDTSFGLGGAAALPTAFTAQHFVIEPDGDIALIGTVTRSDGSTAVAVARLTSDGQPDPSFGSDGLVVLPPPVDQSGRPLTSVSPGGLVVQPDGDIVLTVRGGPAASTSTLTFPASVLERVTATGAIDTSFGQNGQAFIAGPGETVGTFDPLLTANGDILVAVIASGGTGVIQAPTILAISADGQELSPLPGLIPEFAWAGALVALPDGGYLVVDGSLLSDMDIEVDTAGKTSIGPLGWAERLTLTDGASDPDSLLVAQPDGKLIVAGTAPAANGEQAVFVARLFGLSRPAVIGLPRQRIARSARTVTLRLTCSPAQTCNGQADLYLPPGRRQARLAAGSGSFSIAPGHSRNVVIRLTHNGRVRLGGHAPTRVTLTLVLTDGPTRSATIVVPGAR